jgi:hypothetical protein|tara:strand:+ start:285 stop:677 length:393 start_codon:yes stop_codon:yes gene_type:complete
MSYEWSAEAETAWTAWPEGVYSVLGEATALIFIRDAPLCGSVVDDAVYMKMLDAFFHSALKNCPDPTMGDFWCLFSTIEETMFDGMISRAALDSVASPSERILMAKRRYIADEDEIVVLPSFDIADALVG